MLLKLLNLGTIFLKKKIFKRFDFRLKMVIDIDILFLLGEQKKLKKSITFNLTQWEHSKVGGGKMFISIIF